MSDFTGAKKVAKWLVCAVAIVAVVAITATGVHKLMHADDDKVIYQVIPNAVRGYGGSLKLSVTAKLDLYRAILDKYHDAMAYIDGEQVTSADILYMSVEDYEGTLLNITGMVVASSSVDDTVSASTGTRLTLACGGGQTVVMAYLYRSPLMFNTLQAGDVVTVHGYAVRRMITSDGLQAVQVIGVRAGSAW